MAAHDNNGGDRSRDNNRKDSQREASARRDSDNNRWWKPWHNNDNKPKPPVDPAICAAWQTRLNEWVASQKTTSQKDIAFGVDYYAMVQTFVTDQGLTVQNYDALKADVEAKQIAATIAVEALQAPDLNCEADAAETTERGIEKSSYKAARQAMEEYKQSLKQLTEAVRASYGGNGMF